ncbi:MAG: asparagine synthase (glutamine-hydrolyzing) [Coriobacteriaceae bacterium]|jgi:asparagine synthase (glutamine-hydrolysing)|nr:asparagine synthase (glutamine-hydrolyzing) [Coriobacteriaceae bacterium]
MCGICGFTEARETDMPLLKAMCDAMAHRGPDGEGRYFDEGIALGHRRLSLIDLENGSQPMVRTAGGYDSPLNIPRKGQDAEAAASHTGRDAATAVLVTDQVAATAIPDAGQDEATAASRAGQDAAAAACGAGGVAEAAASGNKSAGKAVPLASFAVGDYAIVFNGEIYNYRDLQEELRAQGYTFKTNSDTEVLLVAYIAWGKRLLERVRGMFAFAIWDKPAKELFCARDFFGIKPFYYTFIEKASSGLEGRFSATEEAPMADAGSQPPATGEAPVADSGHAGQFVFASEIKSILEHPQVRREVNLEALEQYLSFQYSVLPETFFKGVFKLPPAHYLIVKPGQKPQMERYWPLDYAIDEGISLDEAKKRIHAAVQESVGYHMVADVEVASFLSSGVDSNYLTASLHAQGGNIKTFTVGFETADAEKYNEISYAKEASDFLDVENYSHVISESEFWDSLEKVQWHMDEPSADPAAVALYFVDREAAKHVKAVLSGEGSDEFFGGYTIYQTPLENARLAWCPKPLLRAASALLRTLGIRGANYLRRAGTPLEQQFIGNADMFSVAERKRLLKAPACARSPQELTAPSYAQVAHLDEVTRMQYIDMSFWLVGDILLKTDKMSMAHSLESRVPFLDKEVWALARTLPTSCKVNRRSTKLALREAAKTLLPAEFCEKRKLGFPVPIRLWLKEDRHYRKVRDAFTSPVAERYFHTQALVALLDEHRAGKADNSRRIWTVYMFLVWHKAYFRS